MRKYFNYKEDYHWTSSQEKPLRMKVLRSGNNFENVFISLLAKELVTDLLNQQDKVLFNYWM